MRQHRQTKAHRKYATDPRVAAIITDVAAQAVAIVAAAAG